MSGQGLVQEEEVAFAGPQRRADAGRTPPRKRDRTPLVPSQHRPLHRLYILSSPQGKRKLPHSSGHLRKLHEMVLLQKLDGRHVALRQSNFSE